MKKIENRKTLIAIRVTCFLLAVLSLLLVLYYFARPGFANTARAYRVVQNETIFGEEKNTVDALYVGHSRVFSGVSPMEIYDEHGIAGYNISQPLQMPWEAYQFICDVLKKQTPKVIALEVDQFFYDHKKADKRSDLKRAALTLWPFLETHMYWKDGFKFPDSNCLKNYRYFTKTVAARENSKMNVTEKRAKMKKRFKQAFKKILKLCDKKKIQVVFFTMPTVHHWNYSMHNTIADYAEKHDIPFLDMSLKEVRDEIGINLNTDYRDRGDHCNYSGAVKASKGLGKFIKEVTTLEDRRGQKKYAKWDKEVVEYRKTVGKVV